MQGTLDFVILKALARESMHGYGIARWVRETSTDELQIEEGTLYPALHRLEDRGLVTAEWGVSENNRRAKFYRLTAAGRRELKQRVVSWERYVRAVARIVDTTST